MAALRKLKQERLLPKAKNTKNSTDKTPLKKKKKVRSSLLIKKSERQLTKETSEVNYRSYHFKNCSVVLEKLNCGWDVNTEINKYLSIKNVNQSDVSDSFLNESRMSLRSSKRISVNSVQHEASVCHLSFEPEVGSCLNITRMSLRTSKILVNSSQSKVSKKLSVNSIQPEVSDSCLNESRMSLRSSKNLSFENSNQPKASNSHLNKSRSSKIKNIHNNNLDKSKIQKSGKCKNLTINKIDKIQTSKLKKGKKASKKSSKNTSSVDNKFTKNPTKKLNKRSTAVLKGSKITPLTSENVLPLDSLSIQRSFGKSPSLRRHVLEKTLETKYTELEHILLLERSKSVSKTSGSKKFGNNSNKRKFFSEVINTADTQDSVSKSSLRPKRHSAPAKNSTVGGTKNKVNTNLSSENIAKISKQLATCPVDDLCLKSTSRKRKKNKSSTFKAPGKNTLKRKRWMFNELNRLNTDYEDDLFENRNFDHFKDLFPDSPVPSSFSISTPKLGFQATPVYRACSPKFRDCISPTQYAISRKIAEECMYKRRKRKNRLESGHDTSSFSNDSSGSEKRKLSFSDLMSSAKEKQKQIDNLTSGADSDMDDSYFSDC